MGGRALLVRSARRSLGRILREPESCRERDQLRDPGRRLARGRPGKLNDRVAARAKRLGAPRPFHRPLERGRAELRIQRVAARPRVLGTAPTVFSLTPVVTLVGTPRGRNDGRGPNYAPPLPRDFRALRRSRVSLPVVRYWLIWNGAHPALAQADEGVDSMLSICSTPAMRASICRMHSSVAVSSAPRARRRLVPLPGFTAWLGHTRSSMPTPTIPSPAGDGCRRTAAASARSRWRRCRSGRSCPALLGGGSRCG